jgi:hypothetical protein
MADIDIGIVARSSGSVHRLKCFPFFRNGSGGGASERIGAALSHAKQNCLFRQPVGQTFSALRQLLRLSSENGMLLVDHLYEVAWLKS